MPPVLALFPPYVTSMKQGEKREKTGTKQGGKLAVFKR
jgi:hypothetical protein